MTTKVINFASDFTDCPGGRLKIYGEFSGEEFREDVLKPALASYDHVTIDLNGVMGFPASFIDEVFGRLVEEMGLDAVRSRIALRLTDDAVALAEISEIMEAHAA